VWRTESQPAALWRFLETAGQLSVEQNWV
jgi:hypothetical protein